MKPILLSTASYVLLWLGAKAELYIYEPFDYLPTTEVNDGRFFGDSTQSYDNGQGIGAWSHRDAGGNGTPNGIAPVNEGDIADEGVTFTDAKGNELPVAGNAYERRQRVGQVAASAPLEDNAIAGLTSDNSTLWMTFLFQDFGFSGPDFGIGLHSEMMVSDDNQGLEAPGNGVGFGIVSSGGQSRNIRTAVYQQSVAATQLEAEPTPTFNGPAASEVFFLALKVNWNEAGTPDEIFAFIIDDLSVEPDEADAVISDSFDFDLETQQSLKFLNFSDTQVGYVDEIRVGTTFQDVTSGTLVNAKTLEITELHYEPTNSELSLTWNSIEGRNYRVAYSTDGQSWESDLDDFVLGDPGDSTTRVYDLSGVSNRERLLFRVEQ